MTTMDAPPLARASLAGAVWWCWAAAETKLVQEGRRRKYRAKAAATLQLLADPERPNREIAAVIAVDDVSVMSARRELEDCGAVHVYRAPFPGRPSARRNRAKALLMANPQMHSGEIARLAGCHSSTVQNARRDLGLPDARYKVATPQARAQIEREASGRLAS